jgi:polyhydroxyalkanoate synthesis regulator phasin
MTDAQPFDRYGPGGNLPPEPTVIERAEALIPACDDWTAKGEINEDEARVLTEFLEQLRKMRVVLKAGAVADRQPHLDALAAIRATVAHLMEPHEQALEEIGRRNGIVLPKIELAIERIAGSKRMTGLLAAFMARKQKQLDDAAAAQRKAAEDAERLAERAKDRASTSGTIDDAIEAERAIEAAEEARGDAGRRPVRARVKGDLAGKATALHAYWSAKIIDWPKARKHYRTKPAVVKACDDAIKAAADKDARDTKDPALAPDGVEFIKREQAQ